MGQEIHDSPPERQTGSEVLSDLVILDGVSEDGFQCKEVGEGVSVFLQQAGNVMCEFFVRRGGFQFFEQHQDVLLIFLRIFLDLGIRSQTHQLVGPVPHQNHDRGWALSEAAQLALCVV